MAESLLEFRDYFQKSLLRFLWGEWAKLGVATADIDTIDDWIIDPEALLLFTCTIGRWQPKLFDEVLDWLTKNARFINIPRLKMIQKRHGFEGYDIMSVISDVVGRKNSRLNWQFDSSAKPQHRDFFFSKQDEMIPMIGDLDNTFSTFGYRRGKVQLRGHSKRFNPMLNSALILKFRSFVGVTARAEILIYLLTHDQGHPNLIAQKVGFSQKNVQDTIVDMTASNIVQVEQSGRIKNYFIPPEYRSLIFNHAEKLPVWITWPPLFQALEMLWLRLQDGGLFKLRSSLQSMELRRLIVEMRPGIQRSGYSKYLTNLELIYDQSYIEVFINDMHRVLDAIIKPQSSGIIKPLT